MGLFDKVNLVNNDPKTMSVKSYCFLKSDEELFDVLSLNPDFELSTADLVEKGYAGKSVYRFYSTYKYDVTLMPDPKNKADKNAVKILLSGKFYGYVNKNDAPTVLKLIKKNAIEGLQLRHSGGPVRRIYADSRSSASRYEPEVTLTITYR